MEQNNFSVDSKFLPPEELWLAIEPLLPEERPKPKGGRPREDDRKMFNAIFYVLRTGIQWKAIPRELGASSTAHDRFQQWQEAGVFEKFWTSSLIEYNVRIGLDWLWQSIDSSSVKAPLGGSQTGPNPTDRAKSGTKRHIFTEANGIATSVVVTGSNRHDKTQVEKVLVTMPILPPIPTCDDPQHFCGDKAYDSADIRCLIGAMGYIGHIKARGDEKYEKEHIPGYRARRWVVERTHSWLNRFRRLLIRWEKKVENYVAMIHLAFAFITFRSAGIFNPNGVFG